MIFELAREAIRSGKKMSPRTILSALSTLMVAAALLTPVSQTPAHADTFTSPSGPPTLTQISVADDSGGAFQAFQPAFSQSTTTYTVSTTVSKPGGITQLNNGLTMCIWLVDVADCRNTNDDGVNTSPNAQTTFLMTWNWDATNDQDVFSVIDDAGNNYSDEGSNSNFTSVKEDNGDISATVNFVFKVSNAMRHSFDWNIQMRADDGTNVTIETLANLRVNYLGTVTTGRDQVSYAVRENSFDDAEGIPMGNYTANANSEITITASNFQATVGGQKKVLDLTAAASDRLVTFRCSDTATFDDSQDILINTNNIVSFSTVSVISDEAPEAIGDHSCRVEYKANIANPNRSYSNTVTIGIQPSDENAPTSLIATTTQTSATLNWTAPAVLSGGATLNSYVIELSTDGKALDDATKTWEFVERVASGTSYTASSLSERSSYDFRVTANTSVGAGGATVQAQTNSSAEADLLLAQQLNTSMRNYTEDSNLCTVVQAIEDKGFRVFAIPTYSAMAESMRGTDPGSNKMCSEGYFHRGMFNSNTELGKLGGFGGNMDDQPFIGMAGFGNNRYLGTAFMAFTDLNAPSSAPIGADDTTYLHELFLNDDLEKEFSSYVINANGTTVNNASSVMETRWSDGHNPNSRGYYSSNRWSSDDFIWGFRAGFTGELDGNGGNYLRGGANQAYGVENDNGGDSQSEFYWGQRYSGTDYRFIMFIAEATN